MKATCVLAIRLIQLCNTFSEAVNTARKFLHRVSVAVSVGHIVARLKAPQREGRVRDVIRL